MGWFMTCAGALKPVVETNIASRGCILKMKSSALGIVPVNVGMDIVLIQILSFVMNPCPGTFITVLKIVVVITASAEIGFAITIVEKTPITALTIAHKS